MGYKLKKTMGWILENANIEYELLSKQTLQDLINKDPNNYELINLDLKHPNINLNEKLSKFVIPIDSIDQESNVSNTIYVFIPPQCLDHWHCYSDDVDMYLYPFFSEIKVKYIYKSIFPYCQNWVADPSLNILNDKNMSDINFMNFLLNDKKEIPEEFLKAYSFLDFNKSLMTQRYMSCPLIIKKMLEVASPINSLVLKPAILLYYR